MEDGRRGGGEEGKREGGKEGRREEGKKGRENVYPGVWVRSLVCKNGREVF